MPQPQLRIAEIFSSVQGEGLWTGVPSTFVRVSGCNLRCTWCDTPYSSWKPEGPVMSLQAIVDEVCSLPNRHVVLTGGEPMLFDAIEPLAETLKRGGKVITIETAGTVSRNLPCDLMSISPKLSNSIPDEPKAWKDRHEATRLNFDVLSELISGYSYQLKFVVDPDRGGDLAEIRSILAKLPEVKSNRVMLMPEGRDVATLRPRARSLAPACKENGWQLCVRLQIELFGDTRGT